MVETAAREQSAPLTAATLKVYAALASKLTTIALKDVLMAFLALIAEVWRLRAKRRYLAQRVVDLEARVVDLEMPPLGLTDPEKAILRLHGEVSDLRARAEAAERRVAAINADANNIVRQADGEARTWQARAEAAEATRQHKPATDDEREEHRENLDRAARYFDSVRQGTDWPQAFAKSIRWALLEEHETRVDAASWKARAERHAAQLGEHDGTIDVLREDRVLLVDALDQALGDLVPERVPLERRKALAFCTRVRDAAWEGGSLAEIKDILAEAKAGESAGGGS